MTSYQAQPDGRLWLDLAARESAGPRPEIPRLLTVGTATFAKRCQASSLVVRVLVAVSAAPLTVASLRIHGDVGANPTR